MTPEQLRAIVADAEAFDGKLMREWDAVRADLIGEFRRGVNSDHPRLMFECNILAPLLEALTEAADEIERLRAALQALMGSATPNSRIDCT